MLFLFDTKLFVTMQNKKIPLQNKAKFHFKFIWGNFYVSLFCKKILKNQTSMAYVISQKRTRKSFQKFTNFGFYHFNQKKHLIRRLNFSFNLLYQKTSFF